MKLTTIAANSRTMAGDTVTLHDDIKGSYRKVYVVQDMVVGIAGCMDSGTLFVQWCERGMNSKSKPRNLADEFTGLILNESGLYEYRNFMVPMKIERECWAIGSGAKAALGAMHMGASPEQAVQIACEIDLVSEGPVFTEELQQKPQT